MASGSSGTGRASSGSKGFDFASDDILCSYEDCGNQESSNGIHSDPGITPGKDFHKSRLTRPTVYSTPAYSQPEDSFSQDLIVTVELTMKKYTDNLLRFLEGISSRMSQLELYCYNLDKSIGEMRLELTRDHGDADAKLKSIEKHLQEVHRSVQILRDKQELAETQKELAKLQTVQKESSSGHSLSKDDIAASPAPDDKKDDSSDASTKQLALALPHQVVPQQQAVLPPPPQAPAQNVSQQHAYYVQAAQMSHPPVSQYLPSDAQARIQLQPVTAPHTLQPFANSSAAGHPYPQYHQQWAQQPPQQVPQPAARQSPPQSQMRPAPAPTVYPPYSQGQPSNAPSGGLPSSMSMQLPYSGLPPPASTRADAIPYGYSGGQGGTGTSQQQPPTQNIPGNYNSPQADLAYTAGGPHGAFPPRGGRVCHLRQRRETSAAFPAATPLCAEWRVSSRRYPYSEPVTAQPRRSCS